MLCFIPGTCRAFPLKSVQVSSFKAENYPSDEHPGINKSVLSLIHSPQIQPVGSREYCLKKKPIDFSYLHYYTSQKWGPTIFRLDKIFVSKYKYAVSMYKAPSIYVSRRNKIVSSSRFQFKNKFVLDLSWTTLQFVIENICQCVKNSYLPLKEPVHGEMFQYWVECAGLERKVLVSGGKF
jgi:hypothetical protein